MRKSVPLLFWALVLTVLVAACNPPAPQPVAQGGPVAWMDAPLNGAALPLVSYEIVFHCSVPSGVAWVELSVDGAILVSNAPPDTTQTLVTTRYAWSPPSPGDYTLQARARNATGVWSEYATAEVMVEGDSAPPTLTPTPSPTAEPTRPSSATECIPSATFIGDGSCRAGPAMDHGVVTVFSLGQIVVVDGLNVDGAWWRILIPGTVDHCWVPVAAVSTTCVGSVSVVEGPTAPASTVVPTSVPTLVPILPTKPILVPTATPAPQSPVIAAPQASTDIFYSDAKCGATLVVLQALVDDPSGASSVTLHYRLKDKDGGAETAWASLPMDRLFTAPATHANWMRTLDAQMDLAGAKPGREYTLQYYIIAVNALGLTSQTSVYQDVTVNTRPCVH